MRSTRMNLALAALFCLTTPAAAAPLTAGGVQAAVRILTFQQPPLAGPVIAAIVYQPGDARSEAEAQTIERAIQASPNAGKASLRTRRVPANALGGLQGARVAFVTAGINYRAVATAATPRSILTISGDPGCAQAGHCVVAINSIPKVQILVSKAATRASNLKFGSAFLMLVKEI